MAYPGWLIKPGVVNANRQAAWCAVTVGNFWVDLVRELLRVLLPLSLLGSLLLVWQGVPLNLSPYVQAQTLEGPILQP